MVTEVLSATVARLWQEVLGTDAELGSPFVAAGGDSFRAVVLTLRVYEELGCEIDYLDVLTADGTDDVVRAVEVVGVSGR